jgi:pyrroline-5-carboxylate reductase
MNKIGFIGYGNMGGTLLRALLGAGALPAAQVIVFTRTSAKLKDLNIAYPAVAVARSLPELASQCDRVFICTGTREVQPVLTELAGHLPTGAHIISIAGTIEIRCLESIFKGKITQLMPTLIAEVGEGLTLVRHNARVLPADKAFLEVALSKIGRVREIREDRFDLAADLTSCAPAFFADILRAFVAAARRHGDFTDAELREMIIPTCYGTAKLLMDQNIEFDGLISRVATKGGITEEGIRILDRSLPAAFDELLTVTLAKRLKSKKLQRRQFGLE